MTDVKFPNDLIFIVILFYLFFITEKNFKSTNSLQNN